MDIKIEVVGKEEELNFPYVVETDMGSKALVINNERSLVLKTTNPMSGFRENQLVKTCNLVVVRSYKILEANYKLKEV